MSKALKYVAAGATIAASFSTLAQDAHVPVGIAGIILDAPIDSIPRRFGLKCTTRVMAAHAPTSKDQILGKLQKELQLAKARGDYNCYSERTSMIGRLRTGQVHVSADDGRISLISISFVQDEDDVDNRYNPNSRMYLTGLLEKHYGAGVVSSKKTSWERWSSVQIEHTWKLPTAKIKIEDEPGHNMRMALSSNASFPPNAATLTSIARIEKKIAGREQKLLDKKAKVSSLAERDLFPPKKN